ncbi:PilC/PilY family type IV pilus protein [Rhodoferax sp.]|uniref:pilus assembly protein n=1 Tax=Rhodoferax sp. TaxID=50421 RepID=UPI002846E6CE|nr:PilC/PilY family type IV pilus protein [Rhodoferax sp.]MDR3369603.1 PilC/PilY family type IV pilus protein [Rhodoferax sp.]
MHTRSDNLKDTMPGSQSLWQHSFGQLFPLRKWSWPKRLLMITLPGVAAVSFIAFGSGTPPSIPAITLSADPLYAPTAADKPALALALSVEFPTVGAQYVDPDNNNSSTTDDVTYSPTIEYLGYYDAESCYTYDDAGTGAPSGQTSAYKRFVRRGPALPLSTPNTANPTWTSRMCWNGTKSYSKDDGTSPAFSTTSNDGFSGNFLNWASSSAIDMLRLSLTGGDRVIDAPNLTVLQRAVIPDGNPISMGNSSNFPSKQLYRSGTSRAITSANFASASYASGVPYFGAVPTAMATAAGTNDIYVANTLNRIYFGTSKSGNNSGGFGSYTLGVASGGSQIGPVTNNPFATRTTGISSFGGTSCASEGGTCSFTGEKEVLYGSGNSGGGWITFLASNGAGCNNTVTGTTIDPALGVSKVCYYRNYSGTNTWTPTTTPTLNSDGYFFARVQVCDRDATTYALKDNRYWNLCTQYSDGAATPHAAFKPTGVIQKYSDQLRLAAFGYLMDPNTSRYGGVLRAPMKYVGAKTFDINGVDNTPAGGNSYAEWNTITGVFNTNPDNNTTVPTADGRAMYLSGVINYVNQFGRTGAVAGRYKTYDPIGELHYQAVRYLQGLQPSSAAISSITSDMYDGYPVFTTWTDPYGNGRSSTADYSCLKSNIVVIGDQNTWDYNNRLPTASAANNIPDIAGWQTVAGKFESNTSGTYLDGAGTSRTISNPNTPNSAGMQSASGDVSLVGSAYWAHTHDIRGTSWTNASTAYSAGTALQRPGLRVKTFIFDVNEYGGSNDASTRRTKNQLFRAAKYGGFESDPSNTAKNPYNTYGNPFKNEQTTPNTDNNYVWADTDTRASRVGEANTYFLQSDARGVLSAFDDIFARASTAARSIAGGAIQSKNLTQAGSTIYQGTFDTSDWTGDLLAIPVSVSAGNVVSVGTTNTWTAATKLAALAAPATSRNIIVGNSGATANPVAVDFTWSTIETSLITSLNKASPTATADGLGQDRLNYLRGDRSKEGNGFRIRSKLMGDVINSGVVYSGVPSTAINDSGYSSFYTSNKDRTPAVFVGANDGMLHAFNGNDGEELFAYIPSWLGPRLSALTSTTYANNHQSYLDGTPTVAEAQVGSSWKTVLVSGTGGGGKGVFALDVTNPATFTASNVMWEFTNADDADLGNVTGRPKILKMRTGTNTYKWFAVFGSGVNNYVSQDGIYSTTGNPALFILDLSKSAGTPWTLGTNYYKISLPVDSTVSTTMPTGLLNFSAALGLDKAVTYIFMGDLHGNLWKLDFTAAATTAKWTISDLSYFKQGTSDLPIPMFIAKDTSGNVQPISAAPNIVFGPVSNSFYIVFGTGKYLEIADKSTTNAQSVYMVYDNGTTDLDSTASTATSAISGRLRLKLGTANASTGVITVPAFTVGRATTDTDTDNPRSGWVTDLPSSGERQISNGTIFGDKIVFGSLIPATSSATACSASGGGGNQYTVDILTGNGSSVGSSVGILGEPLVEDISSATSYTPSDSTGRRTKTIISQVFQQGSNGIAAGSGSSTNTLTRTVIVGRLTWRQINNYQDLKNAP